MILVILLLGIVLFALGAIALDKLDWEFGWVGGGTLTLGLLVFVCALINHSIKCQCI